MKRCPRRRPRRCGRGERPRRADGSASARRSSEASLWKGTFLSRRCASASVERTAVIELAVVPGGYGWVFPKGDHANLGVGGWGAEGPRLREHLARLARAHGIEPESLTEMRGHRLPMRRLGTPAGGGRALLVGDAAGLVDPAVGRRHVRGVRVGATRGERGRLRRPRGLHGGAVGRARPARSASWAAKRAFDRHPRTCSPPRGRQGCSVVVAASCAATSRIRPMRAASRAARSSSIARLAGTALNPRRAPRRGATSRRPSTRGRGR